MILTINLFEEHFCCRYINSCTPIYSGSTFCTHCWISPHRNGYLRIGSIALNIVSEYIWFIYLNTSYCYPWGKTITFFSSSLVSATTLPHCWSKWFGIYCLKQKWKYRFEEEIQENWISLWLKTLLGNKRN